jgi:putative transposase
MSEYRRFFVPGGTYFFTLVAYERRRRFAQPADVQRLRDAVAFIQRERPFRFLAAVVLPEHMHFIWTLPPGDSDYSRRIGRMKVHFTQSLHRAGAANGDQARSRDADLQSIGGQVVGGRCPPYVESITSEMGASPSRQKHRDADVWQRRFWEHTIDDEGELAALLDYIHYNPVKHGLADCPHAWAASSFSRWVASGLYEQSWGCCCEGERHVPREFGNLEDVVAEP